MNPWHTWSLMSIKIDYTRGATHENQTRLRLAFFLKHIAIIAVPVALQNLLTTTGSREDTMMLSSLGEKTVGAVGLCAQFSSLMFAGYWGLVGGGMLFCHEHAKHIFTSPFRIF